MERNDPKTAARAAFNRAEADLVALQPEFAAHCATNEAARIRLLTTP